MSEPDGDSDAAEAAIEWATFCDRMKDLGTRIMGDGFPQTEQAQAEGIRHLARMVSLGLTLCLEYDDPEFPRFLRHNDDVSQWGGNNPDNSYLFARIDDHHTYRIYGNAAQTSGFIVSLRDGFMHQGDEAVRDFASQKLRIDPNGNFDLRISAKPQPGNWLEMLPGATQVGVRIYFDDWSAQTPPSFHIVREGQDDEAPRPLRAASLAAGLRAAGDWIDACLIYWNRFLKQRMPFLPVNGISPPIEVPGGSNEVITYAGGRFVLEPGEALVLTVEPLSAEYIGFVHYSEAWFETGDLAHRSTSLNHNQLHADTDGRTRIVVSATDPGTPNWLDTERRRSGLLTMRTLNAVAPPRVSGELVPMDGLRSWLPDDTRWISAEERRRQIRARREHIAIRFHR
jgi:hypothetical protein